MVLAASQNPNEAFGIVQADFNCAPAPVPLIAQLDFMRVRDDFTLHPSRSGALTQSRRAIVLADQNASIAENMSEHCVRHVDGHPLMARQ